MIFLQNQFGGLEINMPRRKKPKNETPKEASIRQELESIANVATRSEKTSWNRKMNNMVTLLSELKPLEDQILELYARKEVVFDKIQDLRKVMVSECIHPFEQLVFKDEYVDCKFCNQHISLQKKKDNGPEKT